MSDSVAPRFPSRTAAVIATLMALAVAGAVLLWAHYGATVFFEMIRTGFAACFG